MVKYSTLLRTVGNGEETTFSPGFSSDNSSDIEVYIDNIKNNQWTEVDGNIVFDIPPAEGSIIAIYRVTDPLQLPEFTPNTPITAGTLNSLRDLTEKGIEEAYDVGFDALQNYINVQGAIESSVAAADAAAQSEASAAQSATSASNSETNAAQSETNAANSETKAHQWAQEAEDTEVDPGEYSAYHWAKKAENYVASENLQIDGGNAIDTYPISTYDSIKQRADSLANWETVNPTLSAGEPAWVTDRNKRKVGDGTSQFKDLPWEASEPEGWINVKDFGAKGDGVTDDTQAIQDAILYAYDAAFDKTGWRYGIPTIYLPAGDYVIKQSNILLSNVSAGRFNIRGSGRDSTILTYDVPSTINGDYLIKNNGVFGFTLFSDMSFRSKNDNGNFFYSDDERGGNSQDIHFDRVTFDNFDYLFNVQGNSMSSEFSFFDCRLSGNFKDAFTLNNLQAVNWTFYNLYAWGNFESLFKLIQGSNLTFIGGSIIPFDSYQSILFNIPSDANVDSFGRGNSPIKLYGTDFELRGSSKLIVKKTNANIGLIFDSCDLGGQNFTGTYPIEWYTNGKLIFNNCYNLQGYTMDYEGLGSSYQLHLNLFFNYSDIDLPSFLAQSSFVLLDSPNNSAAYPTIHFNNFGSDMHNTTFKARGSSEINLQKTYHSISFLPESDTITYIIDTTRTHTLSIPSAHINTIKLIPISYGGSYTNTIDIKNQDGTTTLASFSWTANNPQDVYEQIVNFTVPNDETLQVVFSTTNTGLTYIKGSLLFLY
jgi:hypothetical protein